VASKVPPGELSLVAFSVRSTGVDQIRIHKERLESALIITAAKYPAHLLSHAQDITPSKPKRHPGGNISPARIRTPPLEEIEGDLIRMLILLSLIFDTQLDVEHYFEPQWWTISGFNVITHSHPSERFIISYGATNAVSNLLGAALS
jgi:hypothetical protein